MKLKSWTETIHVFAQVVLGSFLEDHLCCHKWSRRTIYVVINGPGGPFMLVINGPRATVGRTIYVLPFMSILCLSGPAGQIMTT